MERTKRKLKRTKMSSKKNSIRQQLEMNVIAYHKHLKDLVSGWTDTKLFAYCHPLDRKHFMYELGYKY